MKKVIVLSTVLGLSALGMACGDAATNTAANNANKPAMNAAPVSTPATVASPVTTPATNAPMANAANSAMKPAANAPAANSAMKPAANAPAAANSAMKPAANAMKKP